MSNNKLTRKKGFLVFLLAAVGFFLGYFLYVNDADLKDTPVKNEKLCSLKIQTSETASMLYVDHKAVGLSPIVLENLKCQEHHLSARKIAFEPATATVILNNEVKNQKVFLKLKALEITGNTENLTSEHKNKKNTVILRATHNATFYVDNRPQGMGLEVRRSLPLGEHLVFVQAKNRGSDSRRIVVQEGVPQIVEFVFNDDPLTNAKRFLDMEEPLHWVTRGGATRNNGLYGKAVEMFQHALELDPLYWRAHRQLAFTLPALKRWDEAAFHMKKYLELNPDTPELEFAQEMLRSYEEKQLLDKDAL